MSDTYDYDDTDDFGPGDLRKLVSKLQKQVKDLEKERDTEREARATAEKKAKSASLTDILREKGVKPALAKWLDKDEVEATPEAVDAWLKENGEFFNVKPAEPEQAADADDESGPDNVDPEQAAAIAASQNLDAAGVTPAEVNVMQKLSAINPDSFESTDALLAKLAELGAPVRSYES